ncbi:HTH-type transcriptional regulator GltC [Hartmannibacter diazotrophicus]|uniref:HTH-type transcriptional regulator GltC n=1 Tax=Hartmannibacter diazotrophicus TaxID=1482074 RepID=A0A2C9D886_9HYPH|nr:LysR family transcriptional regulator [Hartmannibacter diazotrophicus]SON56486.1 HTH-type transcriptional regulator GltC [Hartmannibacter diazotrophicus]
MDDRIRHLLSPSLRYFAAAARYGSFRAAARELNVASSAVNRQIIALEEVLETKLFERIGRKIQLSTTGEILLRHVSSTVRGLEGMTGEFDALRGLKIGRVRVATVESVGEDLLPDILSRFSAAYPGIDIAVTLTISDEAEKLVLLGEVDVGLTFNPRERAALDIGFRRNLRIGAVVTPDHPLAKARTIGLADCMAYPLALPSKGLSLRHALDSTAVMRGGGYRMQVEANSLRLMKQVARGGHVVAFQTRIGMEPDLADRTLVFCPLSDADLPIDQFAVISRASGTLKLAPATFHTFVVQELARILAVDDADTASSRP